MKMMYKTEKRFGGEKGIWTASPELNLDFKIIDGKIEKFKIDCPKDSFDYIDIKFKKDYHEFSGKMHEKNPKIGPVDYRGFLLAS